MNQPAHGLMIFDQCRRLIANAETIEDLTELRCRADALRVWAKSAKQGLDAQNYAAELKLRAERKAGELLSKLKLRGGNRRSKGRDGRLSLADLGISQAQSKRWQKQATISEEEFEAYVKTATKLGNEVTVAGLLRLAEKKGPTSSRPSPPSKASPKKHPKEPESQGELDRPNDLENMSDCTETRDLVQEISNHQALLRSLLLPVCAGATAGLLPAQQRAIRYYLLETRRLLLQLMVKQKGDNFSLRRELASESQHTQAYSG